MLTQTLDANSDIKLYKKQNNEYYSGLRHSMLLQTLNANNGANMQNK